jgi:hypothetical protein
MDSEGVLSMHYRTPDHYTPLYALIILALGVGIVAAPLAILAFLFF